MMFHPRHACAAVFLFSACVLYADPPAPVKTPAKPAPMQPQLGFRPLFRTDLDPAAFEDEAQAAALIQTRETLIRKLLSERQRLFTTDPKVRDLHDRILELNKQLAVLLESKRVIRETTTELRLLDARIYSMELKKKTPAAPAPKEKTK